jgi:hypothetical protein
MASIAFVGCSLTAGTGFENEKESSHLWVNLCHRNIDYFNDLELINLSRGGASNSEIFEQAVEAISTHSDLKYLICAWTSMPRYTFEIGFELYETRAHTFKNRTHKLNHLTIPNKYIQDCADRFKALHHLQFEIVKLVKYINIIKNLNKDINIININALCPWDDKFFIRLTDNFFPSNLTEFTQKEILNIHNRDDEEIYKLYKLQHNQYDTAGGIDTKSWANLYNPFSKLQIDFNLDSQHPGIESNKIYYNLVKDYIETNYSH